MQKRILLFLILLLGALFRFYNLDWSLPEIFEEAVPWKKAWNFWNFDKGKFDFNPHFFNYPSFYFYIQWVGQAIMYVCGAALGKFTTLMDMRKYFESDPTSFIYLGRVITSMFGIGTIYLLYRLGKNIFSTSVGLVAALLLTCNPFHIQLCQLIGVDVPLTFFVLLAFFPIWQISKIGSLRYYILGGVYVGFAAGTKYTGLICAIGIVTAHIYLHRDKFKIWMKIFTHPYLWISAASMIVTFFIVSPYCLLDFHNFYNHFQFEQTHMEVGHFGTPSHFVSYGTYIFSIIPDDLTLPVALLTLIGIGYGLWKYRSSSIILLVFPFIYFLIVGGWTMAGNRYIMPIIPLLLLFPALVFIDIFKPLRLPHSSTIKCIAACLLVILPIHGTIDHYHAGDLPDNRSLARTWILKNISTDTLIAKELYTPELDNAGYMCYEFPLHVLYPHLMRALYDYRWYTDFDYIILSSGAYNRYKAEPEKYPEFNRFYDYIDENCMLVKQFDSTTGTGPEIKIYNLENFSKEPLDSNFPKHLYLSLQKTTDAYMMSRSLNNLAILLGSKNRNIKAMTLYRIALEFDPTFVEAWYNLGILYNNNMKRYDEAVDAYKHTVNLDPEYAKAWLNLSLVFWRLGELDSAITAGEQGIQFLPYDMKAYWILGGVYLEKGRIDDALKLTERALSISPDEPEILSVNGLAHLEKKNYQDAANSFQKAFQADPANGKFCYLLAYSHYHLKNYQLAWEYARRAGKLGADTDELMNYLRREAPPPEIP